MIMFVGTLFKISLASKTMLSDTKCNECNTEYVILKTRRRDLSFVMRKSLLSTVLISDSLSQFGKCNRFFLFSNSTSPDVLRDAAKQMDKNRQIKERERERRGGGQRCQSCRHQKQNSSDSCPHPPTSPSPLPARIPVRNSGTTGNADWTSHMTYNRGEERRRNSPPGGT